MCEREREREREREGERERKELQKIETKRYEETMEKSKTPCGTRKVSATHEQNYIHNRKAK